MQVFVTVLDVYLFRFFIVYTSEGLAVEGTRYFQETFLRCTAVGRSVRVTSTSLCVLNW